MSDNRRGSSIVFKQRPCIVGLPRSSPSASPTTSRDSRSGTSIRNQVGSLGFIAFHTSRLPSPELIVQLVPRHTRLHGTSDAMQQRVSVCAGYVSPCGVCACAHVCFPGCTVSLMLHFCVRDRCPSGSGNRLGEDRHEVRSHGGLHQKRYRERSALGHLTWLCLALMRRIH